MPPVVSEPISTPISPMSAGVRSRRGAPASMATSVVRIPVTCLDVYWTHERRRPHRDRGLARAVGRGPARARPAHPGLARAGRRSLTRVRVGLPEAEGVALAVL